jgi:hypothetical protein
MWPRWNRRGDKIYYARGDAVMEVDVAFSSEPRLGTPREVFVRKPLGWPLSVGLTVGATSPDEKRFVIVESQEVAKDLGGILIEENWTDEIGK